MNLFVMLFLMAGHAQQGSKTLYLVPHFHYDVAWIYTEEEYGVLGANLVREHVDLALADPQFKFVIDQAPLLEAFRKWYPDREGDLRRLMDEGRCQLAGGFYVQPDENLARGESYCRQAMYGQQYLIEQWGRRAETAWDIDSFGHSLQIPQILAKSGMRFIAFARPGDRWHGPSHTEFLWKAPDGSGVVAHWMPAHYASGEAVGDVASDDADITQVFSYLDYFDATGNMLSLNGNDFSEPRPHVTEAAAHWNSSHANKVKVATALEFLEAVEPSKGDLEQYTGEFNRAFQGCYGSRIEIKKSNRLYENMLLAAEKMDAFAAASGSACATCRIDEAGRKIAVNQFHDILPGSGIDDIYLRANERYGEIDQALRGVMDEAGSFVAESIDTRSRLPAGAAEGDADVLVAFNTLSWKRKDAAVAELTSREEGKGFRLIDLDGDEIPYQIIESAEGRIKIAFVDEFPPMGYTVYYVLWGEAPSSAPEETERNLPAGEPIETSRYTVTFGEHCSITSIKDKDSGGREAVSFSGDVKMLEHNVLAMSHRHYGGEDQQISAHIQHVSLPVDPGSVLESVFLPSDYKPKIMAMTLLSLGGEETRVDLSSYYNADGMSFDADRSDGNLDGGGGSFPAELFPQEGELLCDKDGIGWNLPDFSDGKDNFISFARQRVSVPDGNYTSIELLMTSVAGASGASLTLNYSGAVEEQVGLAATDWCVPVEYVPLAGRYANELVCTEDTGDEYTYSGGEAMATSEDFECGMKIFEGPVMRRVVASGRFTDSACEREARLYNDLGRMDFTTRVDWEGENKDLMVLFPVGESGTITQGVPYGHVVREEGRYPAIDWTDFGDEEYGVSLLDQGLPDRYVAAGRTYLTLLRSIGSVGGASGAGPAWDTPDAYEKGGHVFNYSLYPHSGSWREAESYKQGLQINAPVQFRATSVHDGSLPPEKSFLEVSGSAVAEVFRRESGRYVVRLFEPRGQENEVEVSFNTPEAADIDETNILGDKTADLAEGPAVSVVLKPQEILTLSAGMPPANACGFCGDAPEEACDDADNDCDGAVDEGCACPQEGAGRPCGTKTGNCEEGVQKCEGGVWSDCSGGVAPQLEKCDGIDNDCDGETDECEGACKEVEPEKPDGGVEDAGPSDAGRGRESAEGCSCAFSPPAPALLSPAVFLIAIFLLNAARRRARGPGPREISRLSPPSPP